MYREMRFVRKVHGMREMAGTAAAEAMVTAAALAYRRGLC